MLFVMNLMDLIKSRIYKRKNNTKAITIDQGHEIVYGNSSKLDLFIKTGVS